jgi:hypothetical protein
VQSEDQIKIINYLNSGGSIYMEGVDIADNHDETDMFNMFGAGYLTTGGENEITSLNGVAGAATEGLNYVYNSNGEDSHYSIDQLYATDGEVLFVSDDGFNTTIVNQALTYNTIISSTLLGCYTDSAGENTKAHLMELYISILNSEMPTGEIVGTVRDEETSEPIEGAVLTVNTFTTTTDAAGNYQLTLPEGLYQLTCQHDDYYDYTSTNNIEIIVDETTEYDFEMLTSVDNEEVVSLATELKNNYPNPFNPETNVIFTLKKRENVKMEIFNIKGQKVRTLIDHVLAAGNHSVVWKGENDSNQDVSSGIYYCKMQTSSYSQVNKMILLK